MVQPNAHVGPELSYPHGDAYCFFKAFAGCAITCQQVLEILGNLRNFVGWNCEETCTDMESPSNPFQSTTQFAFFPGDGDLGEQTKNAKHTG